MQLSVTTYVMGMLLQLVNGGEPQWARRQIQSANVSVKAGRGASPLIVQQLFQTIQLFQRLAWG